MNHLRGIKGSRVLNAAFRPVLILIAIVFVGTVVYAAGVNVKFEAESGSLGGQVASATDATASGGQYVNFTSSTQSGLQFTEDFTTTTAFTTRFDHGWSGALHAGPDDKNGWPGDHDMSCGNPNATHRNINIGPGNLGETSPESAESAFYTCLPADDPAKGHVMTSANTEGYIIAWFSPKQTFTNVRTVCFDNNLTWQGNGEWFQLVFLTPTEYTRKPVWDGVTMDVLDLGYTSPDFPNINQNGPTTPQGTAGAGVKFVVVGTGAGDSRVAIRAWSNGVFGGDPAGISAGPGTADKAPRYKICTTDNGNNTLTVTNASPDGTTHTTTLAGTIPDGTIRIVLEHDEYNPDKHNNSAGSDGGAIGTNTGTGYTYHWDNITVQ